MGFAGSLAAGAMMGGMLSMLAIPTAGGLLMVGLVAGATFGAIYLASEVGKRTGKHYGNVLYEIDQKTNASITIELMGE